MNSLQKEDQSKVAIENKKYSNASSTIHNTSQELISSSSFGVKNQLHIGSKQLNYPHHILQSVYERCNLNALKTSGYAHICDASHFKRENNSKSLEYNISTSGTRDHVFEKVNHSSSSSNDATSHNNYESGNIDVKKIHSSSFKNDKHLSKENLYLNLPSPRLGEESNILASLERLDWKLATISKKNLNNKRSLLTYQGGEISSKLAQFAPPITIHNGPSNTISKKIDLGVGKLRNNHKMPSQPLSTRMIPKKSFTNLRQRQVVGLTNKSQGRSIHQLHPKRKICIPPIHLILNEENKIGLLSPGSIVCYKDTHFILNPTPRISEIVV